VDDDYLAALKPLIDAISRWKELYGAWRPLTPAHMAAYRQPNPEVAEECRRLLASLETAGQVGAAWLTAEGVDATPLLRWLMAQQQPDREDLVVAALLDEAQLAVQCALHHYRVRPGATRGADPADQPPADADVIVSLGDRTYQAGRSAPVVVTEAEDDVLGAFLLAPAYDEEGLCDASGRERAPRILAALATRYGGVFAPAIRRPGKRNAGGYAVRVVARLPESRPHPERTQSAPIPPAQGRAGRVG
jgi:hypothetical protein